jgi:hypothetical protein
VCHVRYFDKERVATIVEVQVKLEGVDENMYISGPGLLLKMRGQFLVPIT